ncbi:unnamed protein product [Closterium sp. NIES-64]|nr:unnamed protein product [Closterium sp. NIES-64]
MLPPTLLRPLSFPFSSAYPPPPFSTVSSFPPPSRGRRGAVVWQRPGLAAIRRDEWFQRDYHRAYPLPDDTEGQGGTEDVLLHARLHPVAELSVRVPHSPSLQASLPVSLSPRTTAAAAPPAAAALGGREAQAGVAEEGRAGGAGEGGAGAGAGEEGPEWVNAFDLIARAHALDLGALFHRRAHPVLRHTRFASRLPPALIRSRLLALAPALHAHAHANLFKVPRRAGGEGCRARGRRGDRERF